MKAEDWIFSELGAHPKDGTRVIVCRKNFFNIFTMDVQIAKYRNGKYYDKRGKEIKRVRWFAYITLPKEK